LGISKVTTHFNWSMMALMDNKFTGNEGACKTLDKITEP